jgi:hypothetical protein
MYLIIICRFTLHLRSGVCILENPDKGEIFEKGEEGKGENAERKEER